MSPLVHSSYLYLHTQQLLHVPCSGGRNRKQCTGTGHRKRKLYSLFRLFLGQQEHTCTGLRAFITSLYKLTKTVCCNPVLSATTIIDAHCFIEVSLLGLSMQNSVSLTLTPNTLLHRWKTALQIISWGILPGNLDLQNATKYMHQVPLKQPSSRYSIQYKGLILS